MLEQVMHNSDLVTLKGVTIYSRSNMKRKRVCRTHPDEEVVLYDPIDDYLLLPYLKLTQPLFRFNFACRGFFGVEA